MEQATTGSCRRKKTQAEVIGKEEKEEQRRISSIKTEYEADMQKELHSQGADTERLQDIANQLAQLEKSFLSLRRMRHWSSNTKRQTGFDRPYSRMATGAR